MTDHVRSALLRFLARKTPRRGMTDEAMSDEEAALCEALRRAAPVKHPSAEWAEDFLARFERTKEAPTWPTVGEIEKFGAARRRENPGPAAATTAEPLTGAALFAKRIAARQPVAENDLWGPVALEAHRRYGVTAEAITDLRAACIQARAAFYGKEAAEQWQDDQTRRWADAKAEHGKPAGKTVSAQRRAELVAWARQVIDWRRTEEATEEPIRHLPTPEEVEAARAANPIIRAVRAAQREAAE